MSNKSSKPSTFLTTLARRYDGLRIFGDDIQTCVSFPIASDQLIFKHSNQPAARSVGELMEVVESTIGGKFILPVEASAEKALAPISSRVGEPRAHGPLATLEIWSLEQGSYDLVLKIPNRLASDEELTSHLVTRFVDQAREVTRLIDNTDLLRFQAGPALTLSDAHTRLVGLEQKSGTRLDTEGLLSILNQNGQHFLN